MKNLSKYLIISSLAIGTIGYAYNNQYDSSYGNNQQGGGYNQGSGRQGYGYDNQGYGSGNQGYNQGYGYGNRGYGNQGYDYNNQDSDDNDNDSSDNNSNNIPDQVITENVMRNIRNTPYLSPSARSVTASTKDGKVTLKGTVKNSDEKDLVEYIAKVTQGVKSVSNDLQSEK